MSADILHAIPWAALAGGAMIGLAASLMILGAGRIAGVSGIAGQVFTDAGPDGAWRIFFLLGLILAPWLWRGILGSWPATHPTVSSSGLIAAGILVGFGTRLGSGCTSGHGVCGLARLSPRSLVATATFVSVGMATVWCVRHLGALF